MKSSDKLEIASNLREGGVDPTKRLLSPIVSQVEKYANQKNLQPQNAPVPGSVTRFILEDKGKFSALLNNGQKVSISQQGYFSNQLYNFLPARYKTLKL